MEKENVMNYVKSLSLFILGLGVSTSQGKFIGISAVIALIGFCLDKDRLCLLKNKYYRGTVLVYGAFTVILVLMSILGNNKLGLNEALKYIDKMTPFLIIYLLLGRVKNYLYITLAGLVTGIFINTGILFMDLLHPTKLYAGRLGALFGHPNKFGAACAFMFPFMICLAEKVRGKQAYFSLVITATICVAIGLFLAGSRGAWMAFSSESILGICYIQFKKNGNRLSKNILIQGIILTVLVGSLFKLFGSRGYDGERILLWKAAWSMFVDHPLNGVGLLGFNKSYVAHYLSPLAREASLPHPHNIFLNFMSETGLIGLVTFAFVVVEAIKTCLKATLSRKDGQYFCLTIAFALALIGAMAHGLVDVICTTRGNLQLIFFLWAITCQSLVQDD